MASKNNQTNIKEKKEKTNQAPITKSDVKKAVKSAPNDIYVDRINVTAFHAPKDLKESLVVLIVGSVGFPEQFTIHRPIGVTDLADNDWVLTRTYDVESLLSRSEDPRHAEIQKRRAKNRTDYLVAKGILVAKDGLTYYTCDMLKPRNVHLDEADALFKAAKASGKTAPNASKLNYLDEIYSKEEKRISDLMKTEEAQLAIEKDAKQTFRTRSGVLENVDQKSAPGLKGLDIRELPGVVSKILFKTLGYGEGITLTVIDKPVPQPIQVGKIEEEEEDDRNDIITELKQKMSDTSSIMTLLAAQLSKLEDNASMITHGMKKDDVSKIKDAIHADIKTLKESMGIVKQDLDSVQMQNAMQNA